MAETSVSALIRSARLANGWHRGASFLKDDLGGDGDIPWGVKTFGAPHHPKPTHPTLPPEIPAPRPAVNTCKSLV